MPLWSASHTRDFKTRRRERDEGGFLRRSAASQGWGDMRDSMGSGPKTRDELLDHELVEQLRRGTLRFHFTMSNQNEHIVTISCFHFQQELGDPLDDSKIAIDL